MMMRFVSRCDRVATITVSGCLVSLSSWPDPGPAIRAFLGCTSRSWMPGTRACSDLFDRRAYPTTVRFWQRRVQVPSPPLGKGQGEGDTMKVSAADRNPLTRSSPKARTDLSPSGRGGDCLSAVVSTAPQEILDIAPGFLPNIQWLNRRAAAFPASHGSTESDWDRGDPAREPRPDLIRGRSSPKARTG